MLYESQTGVVDLFSFLEDADVLLETVDKWCERERRSLVEKEDYIDFNNNTRD